MTNHDEPGPKPAEPAQAPQTPERPPPEERERQRRQRVRDAIAGFLRKTPRRW